MKNRIAVLATLLLLFTAKLNAQYQPLVEEGKYWISVMHLSHDAPSPASGYATILSGDTLVDGQVYKKVYRSNLAGSHPCPTGPCFTADLPYQALSTDLIGLLREDLISKKVYYLPNNSWGEPCEMEEHLLFDFSLEVGDTLNDCVYRAVGAEEISMAMPGAGIVDSLGASLFYGENRNTIYTTGDAENIGLQVISQVRIMEGAGYSNYDIFRTWNSQLIDFCDGGENLCEIISSTTSLINSIDVKIYPNPSKGIYQITAPMDVLESIRIYSMEGVLRKEMTANERIDISTFNSGIYLVELMFENGARLTKKIVKEN